MNKKILFVVNSIDFFISHRLGIAQKASNSGYEVHIIAGEIKNNSNKDIKKFFLHDLSFRSKNYNIFYIIKNIIKLILLIHTIKPDITHIITLKPIILCGLVLKIFNYTNVVISFSGLGYLFINKSLFAKFVSKMILKLLNIVFKIKNLIIIFQNLDDKKLICENTNIFQKKIVIIKGSGVDLNNFNYHKPKLDHQVNFLMASRLLYDKGVLEFIKASSKLIEGDTNAKFTLVGNFDYQNPSCIKKEVIENWQKKNNTYFYNFQKDIKKFLINSHVVVLPSYREGFPKILIEASAIGRAIITTNVPGCRECVVNNKNGFLVKVMNFEDLLKSMNKFINNQSLINKMGLESRKIAEKDYSINEVVKKHINIYNNLLKND